MDARRFTEAHGPERRPRASIRDLAVVGAIASALLLTGLGWAAVPSGPIGPHVDLPSSGVPSASGYPSPIRHVVVVFLENEEVNTVLSSAPYESYLASHYAFAGQFYSAHHYSLPDYVAATSGLVTTPAKPIGTTNIGDLAQGRGLTWNAIMESMPQSCDRTDAWAQGYDTAHNPFIWYRDVVNNPNRCASHVLSLSAWNASLAAGKLPNYEFVAPNTFHDTHNGSLSAADHWLANFTQGLLAHPKLFATTALFVTYDEGTTNSGYNGSFGGHVFTALVSPYGRLGFTSQHRYNTVSLLTTAEWLLGLGRTGHNDNWSVNPPMSDLFDFAPTFTINGTVTGSTGQPLVGANVTNGVGVVTATGAFGNYSMVLPNGNYTLTASLAGWNASAQNISVSGASLTGVNFTLSPSGGHPPKGGPILPTSRRTETP
jgi:Phosphoesterase family/Carboxypeptidase regulatory-like domain